MLILVYRCISKNAPFSRCFTWPRVLECDIPFRANYSFTCDNAPMGPRDVSYRITSLLSRSQFNSSPYSTRQLIILSSLAIGIPLPHRFMFPTVLLPSPPVIPETRSRLGANSFSSGQAFPLSTTQVDLVRKPVINYSL